MKTIKLLFFLALSAINFNLILKPFNIVVGGTQGLALVVSHLTKTTPAFVILLINLITFLSSIFLLDKQVTKGIIISTFIYPFFINIMAFTSNLMVKENWLLIILSGVISGITLGNILKINYSTGGLNTLILILKKYLNISEYVSNMIINIVIIIFGISLFRLKKAIEGLIIIIINSIIVKKILSNVKNRKVY